VFDSQVQHSITLDLRKAQQQTLHPQVLYMSFGDVLALAGTGVPGLDAAVTTGKFHSSSWPLESIVANCGLYIVGVIYNRVRDVKVYRVRIELLFLFDETSLKVILS
jgi:hypothetical protein